MPDRSRPSKVPPPSLAEWKKIADQYGVTVPLATRQEQPPIPQQVVREVQDITKIEDNQHEQILAKPVVVQDPTDIVDDNDEE